MLKKIIKWILLTLFILAIIYGLGRLCVVLYDSYKFVDRQPYLQKVTPNSIVVLWQTPESEVGCVTYELAGLSNEVCESDASRYHRIELTGLTKATRYRYQVASASLTIDNEGRYFTTLNDDQAMTQRVWVVGDSGNNNQAQRDMRDAMIAHLGQNQLDTWIMLGDNAYRSGTQQQYKDKMFQPFVETFKHQVLWSVIGNHDARRWAYYDIFEFPVDGESGGLASSDESYFSFNQGNVHFVMLDSETVSRSDDGDMAQWLKKDLAANKQLWTVAIFHTPPYTKGSHDSDSYYDSRGRMVQMRENILPILEYYDTDLVMAGHSHKYERSLLSHKQYDNSDTFDADQNVVQDNHNSYTKCNEKTEYAGTIYNVAGSSSADYKGITPFKKTHPMLPISFDATGSVLLTIEGNKLQSEFVLRHGQVGDSYTIEKSASYCQK